MKLYIYIYKNLYLPNAILMKKIFILGSNSFSGKPFNKVFTQKNTQLWDVLYQISQNPNLTL